MFPRKSFQQLFSVTASNAFRNAMHCELIGYVTHRTTAKQTNIMKILIDLPSATSFCVEISVLQISMRGKKRKIFPVLILNSDLRG